MNKFLLISVIFIFFLLSCDPQLKERVDRLEAKLSNIESQVNELITVNPKKTFYRVNQDANFRTSPEILDNLIGRIIEDSYVEKLDKKGKWLQIRISANNQKYEGYIHTSLVDELEIGINDFQNKIPYNHLIMQVGQSINSSLRKQKIGLSGYGTIGLLIEGQTQMKNQLYDKIVNFFVNFDINSFKVTLVQSVDFKMYSTIDCIAVVSIKSEKTQLIKILDRNSLIIFHQFVDFNIIE